MGPCLLGFITKKDVFVLMKKSVNRFKINCNSSQMRILRPVFHIYFSGFFVYSIFLSSVEVNNFLHLSTVLIYFPPPHLLPKFFLTCSWFSFLFCWSEHVPPYVYVSPLPGSDGSQPRPLFAPCLYSRFLLYSTVLFVPTYLPVRSPISPSIIVWYRCFHPDGKWGITFSCQLEIEKIVE